MLEERIGVVGGHQVMDDKAQTQKDGPLAVGGQLHLENAVLQVYEKAVEEELYR